MSPNLIRFITRYIKSLNFIFLVRVLRRRIEVHTLNHVLLDLAFANQLPEELGSSLALALDLDRLVALLVEVLDAVVEAYTQVVGGHAQDGADRS